MGRMNHTARSSSEQIVQLNIALDDVVPKVTRVIEVPYRIRLDALHLVIQAAMGWTNSHLYMFTARGASWGEPDPDFDSGDLLPASRTRLSDLVADTGVRSFKYTYDFGDDWRHTVKIGKIGKIAPAFPGIEYPFLLGATGRCPPEDIGGVPGYMECLAALRDPSHPRHAEFTNWPGTDFDPAVVDHARIDQAMAALTKPPKRRRASATKSIQV